MATTLTRSRSDVRCLHQHHHHMKPTNHLNSTQSRVKQRRSHNLHNYSDKLLPSLTLYPALHRTSLTHDLTSPHRPAKPAYPPHEHPSGPRTHQMSKQNAGRSILILQVARCRAELLNEDKGGCGLERCVDLILTSRHVPKSPQLVDFLGLLRMVSSSQKVFSGADGRMRDDRRGSDGP